MTRSFSVVMKPDGADCNLRCSYCYYLDAADQYGGPARVHRMTDSILETAISGYLSIEQPEYDFEWDGGEPTLAGPEFFRTAVGLQKRHARRGAKISNRIQTNATLIGDELAAVFAKHGFRVGVSIDGPPDLHDRQRPYESGRGSHAAVMGGVETLRRHGVEPAALTVITAETAHHARRIYHYLKSAGFHQHEYTPCVEFAADGSLAPSAVDGDSWGRFLCDLYDEWCADPEPARIAQFDAIMRVAAGVPAQLCALASTCRQRMVVEHNGDVFPCDFFVKPEYRLGNVAEDTFETMWNSPHFRRFGAMKRTVPEECRDCAYRIYCRGGCPRHRIGNAADPIAAAESSEMPVGELCSGWRRFFDHALSDLEIKGQVAPDQGMPVAIDTRVIGR